MGFLHEQIGCPFCEGKGRVLVPTRTFWTNSSELTVSHFNNEACSACRGTGRVNKKDWVQLTEKTWVKRK